MGTSTTYRVRASPSTSATRAIPTGGSSASLPARISTSAALCPGALALRKEAAGYPESLADVRTEANVREIIEDYNKRVLADRLRPAVGNLPPMIAKTLDVDDMVTRWRRAPRASVEERERQARAEREAALGAQQLRPTPGHRGGAASSGEGDRLGWPTQAGCGRVTIGMSPARPPVGAQVRRKGAHDHSLRTRSRPDCVRGSRSQGA